MSSTRVGRHVKAPRARVYSALIDANTIAKWKVPSGMTCHGHAFDGREGGRLRISLTYDAPTGVGNTTARPDTYHRRFVLVPNERVVKVDEFERVGDAVMIIGFSDSSVVSKEPHVTTGNITALSGTKDDVRFMQVSAPVEPGNNGSPVFDESGRVIGIALGTGSAIKASIAKTLMDANGINFVVSQHADRKSVSDVTDAVRNAIVFIESR